MIDDSFGEGEEERRGGMRGARVLLQNDNPPSRRVVGKN